jgi:hypothetical protein
MGNMLKGLAEMLSKNGNIIDALTSSQADSQAVSSGDIFNVSKNGDGSSSKKKQGSSHIFDEQGNFLRLETSLYEPSDTNRGTNIYIEKATKNEKKEEIKSLVLLSDYPMPTSETTTGLAKIIQMYASKVDVPFAENENKVGIQEYSSSPSLMFTSGTDIYANSEGGKLKESLSDYYNLQNAIIHEYNHRLNFEKGIKDGELPREAIEHAKVYLEQVRHSTFKKATIRFQEGTLLAVTGKYIQRAINEAGAQDDTIISLVDKFNVALKSYKPELGFYFFIEAKPTLYPPYSRTFKILKLQ